MPNKWILLVLSTNKIEKRRVGKWVGGSARAHNAYYTIQNYNQLFTCGIFL